jgi:hypothetical protein
MVILGLVCWFGLNMFNMFGAGEQFKPDQTFVARASSMIHDGYKSTVMFVSNVNDQIKNGQPIKDLKKKLQAMKESFSTQNQKPVNDLKSITPESLNIPSR